MANYYNLELESLRLHGKYSYTIDFLRNPNYTKAVPVLHGIPYFNEADFFSDRLLQQKYQKLLSETEGNKASYERFIRQKGRRPSYDIYACFQSYNEAFKAFFPFIKILQKQLKPGDLILNLWDRTGWLGAYLQGLFPAQKVISFWEGNKDVLGYKGFHFWYNHQISDQKLELGFADLNKPLPFQDNSIAFVFGLDTFHRFDQSMLLQELLRITTEAAPIIFPHVHLTNAEPDPFFERGCRQLHGNDYDAFFQKLLSHTDRAGYVFPEPEMFTINELSLEKAFPIQSQPNTHHYNALLAILPKKWEKQEQLQPFRMEDYADFERCHLLVNPLLHIDYARQKVHIDRSKYADRVGYLLDRHPIYMEKLNKANHYSLSEHQVKLLYLASRLYSIEEIAQNLALPSEDLKATIKDLQERDICQLAPVQKQHIRLQHYVSTQEYVVPHQEQTLRKLWETAVELFPENIFLVSELDESEFTYEECQELIEQIQLRFVQEGIKKGDRIALITANHFEAVLSILAAAQLGIVSVPIEYRLAGLQVDHILKEIEPKLIFVDDTAIANLHAILQEYTIVQLDDLEDEEQASAEYFSDWLEEVNHDNLEPASIKPEDLAIILYTSGSTGIPKGVELRHGHLFRSSRLITETFHWEATDRFYNLGELDSMSGLRNTCFAPLEVGAAVIIPTTASKENLFSITDSINQNQASILGTTPALLAQLNRFKDRIIGDLRTLRQIICTGSYLSGELKSELHEALQIPVLNYYGLTETTGICIAEDPDHFDPSSTTLGTARSCIIQVVDDEDNPVSAGMQGELRIYGASIMPGYYKNEAKSKDVLKNGWFYTADYARISESGQVELLGRKRDIIKTGDGLLIYTSEIEGALSGHTDIKDIAVVSNTKNEVEGLKIFIVPNSSATEKELIQKLKSFLQSKIGKRKINIEWESLVEIPRNVNGKIIQAKLVS